MMVSELQTICDAMSGAVIAVRQSGDVIAANEQARALGHVMNRQFDGPVGDVAAADPPLSVETVFDADMAKAVAAALRARRSEGDPRIAVMNCDGEPVALVMERQPAAIDSSDARDVGLDALAMLAHDLRGALSNVCGAFALLDEDLGDDAEHSPRISAMRGALAHFSDLIGAALDLDALSAGRINVKARDINIREFAESVMSIWQPKFAENGVELRIKISAETPETVRTDPMRLRQIVFNLLGNAAAHSRAKEVRLVANGFQSAFSGEALFAMGVEDDGVGLPDHVLDVLRGPDSSALYGEGRRRLGLNVVHGLAKAMGGSVVCRNLDNGGAHICVKAPVGVISGAGTERLKLDLSPGAFAGVSAAEPSPGLAQAISEGGVRGLKALLAEDNATNQLVATQMLDKLGCAVEVASDGLEAVEMLAKGDYDFLLVDIEMPKMSGIDVLRKLRAGEAGPAKLPAIALTAYAMAEHRRKVAEAGADGMIAKPILGVKSFETDLVEILGRVVKSRGAQADLEEGCAASVKDGGGLPNPDIDRAIFDELIDVIGTESSAEFLERVEIDLADVRLRIRNGVRSGDMDEIRAGAHILISVAGAIGARKLQSNAHKLHTFAIERDVEGARALVKEGDAEYMAVTAFIYRRRAGAPQKDA